MVSTALELVVYMCYFHYHGLWYENNRRFLIIGMLERIIGDVYFEELQNRIMGNIKSILILI